MADYKLPIITGTSLAAGDLLRWDGNNWVNYPDSNYAGGSDEKVGIDADAAAGYLGAASGDGVLRTGTSLSYVDGGDSITLNAIQDIQTSASPTFAGLTVSSANPSEILITGSSGEVGALLKFYPLSAGADIRNWIMTTWHTARELLEIRSGDAKGDDPRVVGTTRLSINALTGNIGMGGVTTAVAKLHIDQAIDDAAIPTLILDQADISEGFINFIGSDRGVITGVTNSLKSVRVELGGVVYRLALYVDA